ncbi:hypothetical protein IWZ03DRAFT_140509 [Phyllosticta citriasiana]|uniref:Uncharacterized protein n=1 Tax=Phyllosticta citriasiana TaxID=595635 RepID=A0ABR1KVF0_9PEZI
MISIAFFQFKFPFSRARGIHVVLPLLLPSHPFPHSASTSLASFRFRRLHIIDLPNHELHLHRNSRVHRSTSTCQSKPKHRTNHALLRALDAAHPTSGTAAPRHAARAAPRPLVHLSTHPRAPRFLHGRRNVSGRVLRSAPSRSSFALFHFSMICA